MAGVLQRALAFGRHTDNAAFADGEHLAVHLVLTFALEDEIELLVGLVGVQETAVLTGNKRLERQLAASGSDGLPDKHLTLDGLSQSVS